MQPSEIFSRIIAPTVGSILSLLLYTFQYSTYRHIEQTHSTGDVNVIPILMLHANSLFWIPYGYLTNTPAIIPINTVGALFTLFYIILYYSAAEPKNRRLIEVSLMVLLVIFTAYTGFAVYALPALHISPDTPLGVTAITANIAFYAAPLSSLYQIIKTKSTATLSLPLTCCSFACAIFWTIFGVGENDFFVWIPNALGVVFSTIQVILFVAYRKHNKGRSASLADPNKPTKKPGAYSVHQNLYHDDHHDEKSTILSV